jgi:phage shock protein PspC (stress-responsive transcriptional regulator)
MKKTVSVNIKGINFLIEEDAYELLYQYLKRLEQNLTKQEGSKDILEDVELRIAELCQDSLNDKKEVIEIEDIKKIIATLGQPEDFIDEDNEQKNSSDQFSSSNSFAQERRLYRDMENAKIAGICGGLSNYLNVDVIVIRIIFLLFLFVGGFGVPLYIILWIVIPQASSSIDRLRMQGKPITVDSLKEEVEQAAERVSQSSKSFARKVRNDENYTKRFTSLGNLITTIVGVALLGFGAILLITFLVFVLGLSNFIPIETIEGHISFNELGSLVLSSEDDIVLSWIGIFLTALSVILFFISNGTYLVMKIKNRWSKMASLTLILLGVIGTSICFYIGSKAAREMVSEAKIERQVGTFETEELLITTDTRNKIGEFEVKEGNRFSEIKLIDDQIQQAGIEIHYKPSKDSLFHVYQCLSAHSYSYFKAISKAKNIEHQIKVDANSILVCPYFSYPKQDKLRAQEVKIIIEIPAKKSVKVNGEKVSLDDLELEEIEKYGFIHHSGEVETWD